MSLKSQIGKALIASILAIAVASLGFSSVTATPSNVGGSNSPDLERIVFVDRVLPTHENITPSETCSAESDAYKTISGGIKWKSFPVKYSIDASSSGISEVTAEAAVKAAFDTWDAENHGGDASDIFFVENNTSPHITVEWASLDGPGGTAGVTGINYNPGTKEIVSADIIFDSDDTWNILSLSLSCSAQSAYDLDIGNVATHEIGHAIGLDHVNSPNSRHNTMYTYIIQDGETYKRTLASGDQLGIEFLYGGSSGGGGDSKCPPGKPDHPKCSS